MAADETVLFTPIRIGALELPGRLFKTATAETRASADGFVTDEVVEFYRLIAMGDTPLIITGNIYVSRQGKSAPRQLGADDDDKIAGLVRITDVVHAHGGRIFAQLNHCGRQVVPDFVGATDVVSASAVKDLLTGTRPRAMSAEEIAAIVEQFGEAARRCRDAGFDGVEMHSANGYLMSQFLTPYTNRRDDEYGGSLERRTRFAREVLGALRRRVGVNFPVSSVGGFRTRQTMEAAIARGLCDAVSAGRPFLADPFFYRHVRDGTPGPRCVDCNACVGHLGAQPADCYHPQVRADKDVMLAQVR